jgi:hypothetical protein
VMKKEAQLLWGGIAVLVNGRLTGGDVVSSHPTRCDRRKEFIGRTVSDVH